jgi:hypothetical protein
MSKGTISYRTPGSSVRWCKWPVTPFNLVYLRDSLSYLCSTSVDIRLLVSLFGDRVELPVAQQMPGRTVLWCAHKEVNGLPHVQESIVGAFMSVL